MADLGYLNMFAHDIQRMASFYADLFQLEEIRESRSFFLLTAPGTAVRQTLRGVLANLLDITQLYCEQRRYKYYKNKAS